MKKLYTLLLFTLALGTLVVSCSKEEEALVAPDEIKTQIPDEISHWNMGGHYTNPKPIVIDIRLDEESFRKGEPALFLSDNLGNSGDAITFTNTVDDRTVVVWRLAPNSGIDKLMAIRAKDNNFEVFPTHQPVRLPNGWVAGRTKNDTKGEEAYMIDIVVDGVEYSIDPVITVEPSTSLIGDLDNSL